MTYMYDKYHNFVFVPLHTVTCHDSLFLRLHTAKYYENVVVRIFTVKCHGSVLKHLHTVKWHDSVFIPIVVHWSHCGIFENGVLLMYTLEELAVLQTLLLLVKRLNKTETPIF